MVTGRRSRIAAALVLLPLAPQLACAQSASDRISGIETQIRQLQEELRRVKRDLAQRDAQVRAAQQEARQARDEARQRTAQLGRPAGQAEGGSAPVQPPQPVPAGGPAQLAQSVGGAGQDEGGGQGPTSQQQSGQATSKLGTFRVGGVTVQLGGFIEAAGIYRTRNATSDVGTGLNAIPEMSAAQAHEGEFRASARQSRLSLLVQGQPSPEQSLTAYFETDFLGTGPSSNSVESNSYNLRLRQAYAQYDNADWGLHILGGQAWSLLTAYKTGLVPRQENVPLTIDAQYNAGFTWARQAQIRVAKSFDNDRFWLAASLEEPQTTFYTGPNGAGTIGGTASTTTAGGSQLNSGATYSDDVAPDIVVKAAADPGWGHYEVYGLARFLHDRVDSTGNGRNNTRLAGGGGAATLLPVIKGKLDVQASFLGGIGIGRYGTGQFQDATLAPSGRPVPLPEIQALIGLVGHPVPSVDLYAYFGTERILDRRAFTEGGKAYGYGSPLYVNTGCGVEASTAACTANTSSITEGTIGGWWRFLHGEYGTMQVGASYAYAQRDIFGGVGGAKGTDDNIFLTSFRYAPFQ